jgi:hypothetical protein
MIFTMICLVYTLESSTNVVVKDFATERDAKKFELALKSLEENTDCRIIKGK